jgi:hypothetical protein
LGCLFDCFADADIGAAAADVAGHGIVNVGIARMRVAREKRRRRYDLARLAVAALNDFLVEPGLWILAPAAVVPIASIVVISEVPKLSIVVMQERVATPSIWTVQAPQSAIPQPNFVPVIPSTSRSTQSSGVSPSTSTVRSTPLTLILNGMVIS